MLKGCRHLGGLGIALLMGSGCVRFNPAYEQADSASGGQSGTSATGNPGSMTSGMATVGSATTSSTTAGTATTEDPTKTGTTDDSTADTSPRPGTGSGTVDTGSVGSTEDTDPSSLTLYPSVFVAGDFASIAGSVDLAASEVCVDSAIELGLGPCRETFPVLGWPAQALGDLVSLHPALAAGPLSSVEGDEVAESFDGLLAGTVASDFAELVLAAAGGKGDGRFWWGYSNSGDSHCGSWSELAAQGTTRIFAPAGVDDDDRSCADDLQLLCVCIQ